MKKSDFLLIIFTVIVFFFFHFYAYGYDGFQWDGSTKWSDSDIPVKYYVNSSGAPYGFSSVIQDACDTWNVVSCSDFRFTYQGLTFYREIAYDGYNVWCMNATGAGMEDYEVALTCIYYNSLTGKIKECDVEFNGTLDWSACGYLYSYEYDVENVAVHEAGHWLSLDDLYGIFDTEKTMYGGGEEGETKKRTLVQGDINGICYIYPASVSCSLTINSPYAGQEWEKGEGYYIRWSTTGTCCGSYVKIMYKYGALDRTIATSTSNDGSYYWTIPSYLAENTNYKIKISSTSNPSSCYDYSDFFSIISPTPCSLTITSPDQNSQWEKGEGYYIRWSTTGTCCGSYVKIMYKYGALDRTIATSTSNDGSYYWTIPSYLAESTNYKIKISSTSNPSSCYDYSDSFSIFFDLANDPDNCGTIGNVCEYNHAEDLCVVGECIMGACEAGYHDLNNDPNDGCEYFCIVSNGGKEICDDLDNNCDGFIDEGVNNNCINYADCTTYNTCDACPDAPFEVCDNIDNDCNDLIDDNCNNPPFSPSLNSPTNEDETDSQQPILSINNAIDPDSNQTMSYTFEVYSDQGLISLITSISNISEGENTTEWQVDVVLDDNCFYFWRAIAHDGSLYSNEWMNMAKFFVNTENDPPTIPTISSPPNQSEVTILTPKLGVNNSIDIDLDLLTYEFQIYTDQGANNLYSSITDIAGGNDGTTSWQVSPELNDNTFYWWRAQAVDNENETSGWTDLFQVFVNTSNDQPSTPGGGIRKMGGK